MKKRWVLTIAIALALGFVITWSFIGPQEINQEGFGQTPKLPKIQTAPDYLDAQWANNKMWYDGNAEVNKYEAEMTIYGQPRSFEYIYVFVKEEFTPEYRVKTDEYGEQGLYTVMKCNQFARVPTDNYPYHFLTSVFIRWENPAQLHKLTASSQEWCGNTFKEFTETIQGLDFSYHSYWDGQGNGKMQVDRAWFEDQLAYTLRALKFEDGLQFSHALYPTEKHSKAQKPQAVEAQFAVSREGGLWKVQIESPRGKSSYWFEKAYPNKLQKARTWYGLKLDLKKSARYPYWSYTPEGMQAE